MEDSIDSVKRILPQRSAERVAAPARISPVRRDHEEEGFTFEDQIDIAPITHLQNAPDEIDLSLEMIRALIAGELPPEAVEALSGFAPIGDLKDGIENCDRVQQKGQDFITWPSAKSLTQSLAFAAS